MRRKWQVCLCCLHALSTAVVSAQSNRPATNWETLQSLPAGSSILLTLQDGKFIQGRLASWSAESIDVASKGATTTLRSSLVRRVTVQQKNSRWKGAMIGALAGFGVGFPIGAAWAGHLTDRNNPGFATRVGMGAGMGMFGAGIGAPVGALTRGVKQTTVFQAKDRP